MKVYIKSDTGLSRSVQKYFLQQLKSTFPEIDIRNRDFSSELNSYRGNYQFRIRYDYGAQVMTIPYCRNEKTNLPETGVFYVQAYFKIPENESEFPECWEEWLNNCRSKDLDSFAKLMHCNFVEVSEQLSDYCEDLEEENGVDATFELYELAGKLEYYLYIDNTFSGSYGDPNSSNLDPALVEDRFDEIVCKYYRVRSIQDLGDVSNDTSYRVVEVYYGPYAEDYYIDGEHPDTGDGYDESDVQAALKDLLKYLRRQDCLVKSMSNRVDSRQYYLLVSTNSELQNLCNDIRQQLKKFKKIDVKTTTKVDDASFRRALPSLMNQFSGSQQITY